MLIFKKYIARTSWPFCLGWICSSDTVSLCGPRLRCTCNSFHFTSPKPAVPYHCGGCHLIPLPIALTLLVRRDIPPSLHVCLLTRTTNPTKSITKIYISLRANPRSLPRMRTVSERPRGPAGSGVPQGVGVVVRLTVQLRGESLHLIRFLSDMTGAFVCVKLDSSGRCRQGGDPVTCSCGRKKGRTCGPGDIH